MNRLSKELYLMALARAASLRSTCPRRSVGAVLATLDGRIISTGYNGAPPGMTSCLDGECVMHEGHCINTIHAEINALLSNTGAKGHLLISTDEPCLACFKAALSYNKEIRIFAWREYKDPARDQFITHHSLQRYITRFTESDMKEVENFFCRA